MGKVVDLQSRRPHIQGPAICTQCDYTWHAVEPVGTKVLDCPECKTSKGLFAHPCEPEVKFKCNCGEMLFWITQDGPMCRGCGILPVVPE